jgi:deoxyribodipyrimidine photo-lyase
MPTPHIIWFRQDLRLADQAAVRAAAEAGPMIAAFVLDESSEGVRPMGGASRWWLNHSLASLDADLRARGGRLLLLRGRADAALLQLADATGAAAIHALHHSEPWWGAVERRLGPRLTLHDGATLVRPGLVRTKGGDPYRVFTPYWRAHAAFMPPALPRPVPAGMRFADAPEGERLEDWHLLPTAPDWATGFADWRPGAAGAAEALADFAPQAADYDERRNFPAVNGTSRLSPHLHFGEISPAAVWHTTAHAPAFQRQLVWRDFAHELLALFPDGAEKPHRPAFDRMRWTDTASAAGAAWLTAWQRGQTGYPLVDAGMRQLWQTGWMHNRVRMVVASFLVKHLRIDWREGERWFWDTLLDADLANNAMGWQWVMGSGVDSSPYYRIFAPVGQSEKFDAGAYIRRFVPELADLADAHIHAPWEGGPQPAGYPPPIVEHKAAREAALAAYAAIREG